MLNVRLESECLQSLIDGHRRGFLFHLFLPSCKGVLQQFYLTGNNAIVILNVLLVVTRVTSKTEHNQIPLPNINQSNINLATRNKSKTNAKHSKWINLLKWKTTNQHRRQTGIISVAATRCRF